MSQPEALHQHLDLDMRFGTVGEAMTTAVVTLEPATRASEAALMLSETGVAGGPVIEGGRVVGVITLRDLLQREGHTAPQTTGPFLRGERHLTELNVADVMTKEVVTARADWPLTRAVVLMEEADVNRLPVLDAHDRPVGILARDDVVRAIAKGIREELARTARPARPAAVPGRHPRIPPD